MKSTVEEIRARFDNEVERFSNLDTGQAATMDARLCMELVTSAARATTPAIRSILDIGCGAGNYTLMLLKNLDAPAADCTLIDLSRPMLDRATQRVGDATTGKVTAVQGDMRELDFGAGRFDVILTAASFHHLREESEWHAMFAKCFAALRPGGSMWTFDLIEQVSPAVHAMMWTRYGEFLRTVKDGGPAGDVYRQQVFDYIAKEDTPRPLMFQIDAMRRVGFTDVDVLHKNGPFAAFGGVKR